MQVPWRGPIAASAQPTTRCHGGWIAYAIIIHDTVYVPHDGIDDVVTSNIRIYQHNGYIVVEEADGGMLPVMVVYDAVGRRIGLLRPAANNLGEK